MVVVPAKGNRFGGARKRKLENGRTLVPSFSSEVVAFPGSCRGWKYFPIPLDTPLGLPHNSASPNDGDAKKQQKTAAFSDVL
jgi:hypothetical protein